MGYTTEKARDQISSSKEGFINVEQPVPIYVVPDGPKALMATGAYGDGRICSYNQTKALLMQSLKKIELGASEVNRICQVLSYRPLLTLAF